MFVFDTDHFSILLNEPTAEQTRLLTRLAEYERLDFFVSIISFQEQVEGWNALLNRATTTSKTVFAFRLYERLLKAFTSSQVLSFDDRAAKTFDELRSLKIRVGKSDLRIAAIALSRGLTLLTRNTIDFARIPGLSFEDWTMDDSTRRSG